MKRLLIISIVFLALAILYFSPVQSPSKLAYPVAFLGIMALIDNKRIGIFMAYGLVLSALGDWQGTQGEFFRQMALFGLAHIAYICYFASRIENKQEYNKAGWRGALRTGVIVYCLLILTMLRMALLQRDIWFALGATLFVISDFILAWNKFVSPIDYAAWCIMVPYYGAQWLLFYRATSVASGACSCTSQAQ